MNFSKKHTEQIHGKGLTTSAIEVQLRKFGKKIPYVDITAHASVGHGIIQLNTEKEEAYIKTYEEKRNTLEIIKFTPASGAATRMFKFLYKFLESYKYKINIK